MYYLHSWHSVVEVELYDTTGDTDVLISRALVDAGLAHSSTLGKSHVKLLYSAKISRCIIFADFTDLIWSAKIKLVKFFCIVLGLGR